MSGRLSLSVTRRAAREIRAAFDWWDANRPAAPEAFRQAIATAFELITRQPRIGARATNTRLQGVRRIHLAQIRYYLYYRVRSPEKVDVLALWHTSRHPSSRL